VAQPYCFDRDYYLVWTWIGQLKYVELEIRIRTHCHCGRDLHAD
jgi:hypothetical protein